MNCSAAVKVDAIISNHDVMLATQYQTCVENRFSNIASVHSIKDGRRKCADRYDVLAMSLMLSHSLGQISLKWC